MLRPSVLGALVSLVIITVSQSSHSKNSILYSPVSSTLIGAFGRKLDVYDRQQEDQIEEVGQNDEITHWRLTSPLQLAERVKKLAGLVRCFGWGPGCSYTGYQLRKLHKNQVSTSAAFSGSVKPQPTSNNLGKSSLRQPKVEPFFALTSGKFF